MKTVIGMFESRTDAKEAQDDLLHSGLAPGDLTMSDETKKGERGFWDQVKDWLGMEESAYYEEGVRRGKAILAVKTSDDRADLVVNAIQRHHPIDVDVEAQQWQQEGWQAPRRDASEQSRADEQVIPLAEEELRVSKRRVEGGGVRIYTHVEETPVEQDIELTDEHVDVERRRVDRPAGEDAFQERTIEAKESHEEPVVRKEAHVTEEVVLHKSKDKHTETVRDTLRHTEVDIDKLDEEAFRQHLEKLGVGKFKEHRPAFLFGRDLARDQRYEGRDFDAIETDVRQDFEQRNIGSWDEYGTTVRSAYDWARGKSRRKA